MARSTGTLRPGKPPPARRRFPLAEILVAAAALGAILLVVTRSSRAPEPGPRIAAATPGAASAAPAAVAPTVAATLPPEPSPVPSPEASPEPTRVPTRPARPTVPPPSRESVRVAVAPPARPTALVPSRVLPTAGPQAFPQSPVAPEAPPQAAVMPPAPTFALPAPRPAPPRPAATDQDRIRETVQLYEKAQDSLDADLYARVFPTVDHARIARAFESFRSQSVEFEIKRIELEPGASVAIVRGFEKRVAVPRAGSEQRMDADRVLRLQKRGDSWIITAIE